jgi:xanthine dehydrogenase iron-sulfur cluster and FAD-binding subunit A
MKLSFNLNGSPVDVDCVPGATLLAVLRGLGCWSVRYGSPTGETGAAAVLLDGRLVSSDVMLAAQVGGHQVTTVEALDVATDHLDPIEPFVETGASSRILAGDGAGRRALSTASDPSETRSATSSGVLDRETGYVRW